MEIDIGLSEKARKHVSDFLAELFANTYLLYMKSQNFHWNLEDSRFYSLHLLFEAHYQELADAVDLIAEKIRSLGFFAPGTLKQILKLASLKEVTGHLSGDDMLKTLVFGHETICRQIHEGIKLCQSYNDESSMDLLIERLRDHEKKLYFLRSHFTQ